MTNAIKSTKSDAEKFVQLIQRGIDSWVEAGKFVASKIDEDPDFLNAICDQFPHISPEMVMRFDALGRKQIHPQLLLCDGPGPRRLRKLPYTLQEKFSAQPIDLLINTEKGWETLKVDVRNLTPDQAAQVFAPDGIRTEAAQRAFVEDRASKRVAPPTRANLPYRISGKKLVVIEPCTFDRKEIAQLLADMES